MKFLCAKQPEFKHAAVKVLKAEMPWSLLAMAWLPNDQVLTARGWLQALMARFPFASCTPFANQTTLNTKGQQRSGLLFRASAYEAPDAALLAQIESILQLDGPEVMRYADARRGQRRAARLRRRTLDASATLEGFLLAGDTSAQGWISTLLQDEQPAQAYARALMAPGAQPPQAVVSRGKTVCTCFNVTDTEIDAHLAQCVGAANQRLESLQSTLKCGTNCGSCLPQLQRIVKTSLPIAAPDRQTA